MKVTFVLEQEDYVDFNLNHVKVNPKMQKQILKVKMISIFMIGATSLIAAMLTDISDLYWASMGVILAIGFYFYVPKMVEKNVRKGVPKILENEKDNGLFEEITIELLQDGISKENICGTSFSKWEDIKNVYETGKHIFAYDSSVSAFIIPKRAFKLEAEERNFLKTINNKGKK